MDHLYHGSTTQNIKILEPRIRYTPAGKIDFAAIYASSSASFAACHSFSWSSDQGIDIEIKNSQIVLVVPRRLKDCILMPISIYKVSAADFIQTKEEETGYTWHSIKPVPVLEEDKYQSVKEALEKTGGAIRYV